MTRVGTRSTEVQVRKGEELDEEEGGDGREEGVKRNERAEGGGDVARVRL